MSALVRGGRRADRFASLVEATRSDVSGPRPVAPLGGPTETERALLDVVAGLRAQAVEPPMPRPDFAASLRDRLLSEADALLVPTEPVRELHPSTFHRPVRGVAAAAAAVVLVGTAGMAVAARDTTTGDPLYQVKRGMESIGTTFSLSEAARGRGYLAHAQTRLREVAVLLDRDADATQVHDTLDSFATAAENGSTLMFRSYARTSEDEDVVAVREFAQGAMDDLTTYAESAPRSLQSDLSAAAATVYDVDEQARVLCACNDGELTVPRVLRTTSGREALGTLIGRTPVTGTTRTTGAVSAGATTGAAFAPPTIVDVGVVLTPLTPILGGLPPIITLPPVLTPGSGPGNGSGEGSGGSGEGSTGGSDDGDGGSGTTPVVTLPETPIDLSPLTPVPLVPTTVLEPVGTVLEPVGTVIVPAATPSSTAPTMARDVTTEPGEIGEVVESTGAAAETAIDTTVRTAGAAVTAATGTVTAATDATAGAGSAATSATTDSAGPSTTVPAPDAARDRGDETSGGRAGTSDPALEPTAAPAAAAPDAPTPEKAPAPVAPAPAAPAPQASAPERATDAAETPVRTQVAKVADTGAAAVASVTDAVGG